MAAEEVDDRRQGEHGGRVPCGLIVHEHDRVLQRAALLLGQRDDPVHPVGRGRAVGLPVLGVHRPYPEFHPALLRQAERARVVCAARRPERAWRGSDQGPLLGDGPVHLRGLRGGGQGGHVRVVPGVVAEQVARARFAADQLRPGRCVLPEVEERGRHALRAQDRQDRRRAGPGAVVKGQGHGLARPGRVIVRPVGRWRAARCDLGRADLRRGGDPPIGQQCGRPGRPLVRGRGGLGRGAGRRGAGCRERRHEGPGQPDGRRGRQETHCHRTHRDLHQRLGVRWMRRNAPGEGRAPPGSARRVAAASAKRLGVSRPQVPALALAFTPHDPHGGTAMSAWGAVAGSAECRGALPRVSANSLRKRSLCPG